MKLHEMDGFLKGKCLPGDMLVNETHAEYLVRKFAELQSALDVQSARSDALTAKLNDVCAENAALKSGTTYFAFAPEYGFDYFANKQDAIDTAQAEIDAYRDDAFDGWDEDVRRVSWGIVVQKADGFDAQGLHISDSQHTYQTCDYQLVDSVETPATDAWLNEQRAVGVDSAIESAKKEIASEFQYQSFDNCIIACARHPQSDLSGKVEMVAWLEWFAAQLRGSQV